MKEKVENLIVELENKRNCLEKKAKMLEEIIKKLMATLEDK